MTVLWFVVWLIADRTGSREPLLLDPVNVWALALILAIGLDLGSQHTRPAPARRATRRDDDQP